MGNYTYDLADGYGVDPQKIVVLPFPVTWTHQPEITDLPTRPTVLFCGRLIQEKGVHILLQAMKLVHATCQRRTSRHRRAMPITKPTAMSSKEMVESLGIKATRFRSSVASPNERYRCQLHRDSWILVIPSICEEGLGMVMVEAGLMGRAVIGSNLGGITDFVIDGANGHLVPPGDVDKLAAAIRDILEDRTRAVEMGNQNNMLARKYLENFDQAMLGVQQAIYKLRR